MPALGTLVGSKFRIERILGRGGMGTVYAATHIHLGTTVALKFLSAEMAKNPRTVERFMREARASASLRSDHVCRVSDVATEGETPYIVMELLEGRDLAKVKREGPLAPTLAAEYVLQACAGVAEAHAVGIVHRDLKPGNLWLAARADGSPLVKVLDFGVAKGPTQDGDFSLTQTSNIIGSPGYMSPEQLRSSKIVDQRSDIWALGVILYELVMGVQPFRAETITDLALAIAMDPTPPLGGMPPAYAAIVKRCLEKDPSQRFQDVGALAVALAPLALGHVGPSAVQMLVKSATMPQPRLSHAVTAVVEPAAPLARTVTLAPRPTPDHVAVPTVDGYGAVTTLASASGVVNGSLAPARDAGRRMPWIPLTVAAALTGIGVAVLALGGFGGSTTVRPAAAPVVAPAFASEAAPALGSAASEAAPAPGSAASDAAAATVTAPGSAVAVPVETKSESPSPSPSPMAQPSLQPSPSPMAQPSLQPSPMVPVKHGPVRSVVPLPPPAGPPKSPTAPTPGPEDVGASRI